MSLDFNLQGVKDYNTVCWDTLPERNADGEYRKAMKPKTQALIFATMAVGMGRVDAKTYREFYARLSLWAKFCPGGTAGIYESITLDDVRKHIGLSTNVASEPQAKWLKRTAECYMREVLRIADGAK